MKLLLYIGLAICLYCVFRKIHSAMLLRKIEREIDKTVCENDRLQHIKDKRHERELAHRAHLNSSIFELIWMVPYLFYLVIQSTFSSLMRKIKKQ